MSHRTTCGWRCANRASNEIPENFGTNPFVTLGSLVRAASLAVLSVNAKPPPQSFYYSCTGCRSRHPDGTHIGGWGYAPNHEGEVQVEHCFACHGVLVKSRNAGVTSRTYWRVGSKNGEATGSVCLQNGTHVDQVQRSCDHEYVELYSNAKTSREAARVRSELGSNPIVVRIMSSDMAGLANNLSYASEGSTHFWCWRCGYYLNLNPSRYSLLPKVGVLTGVA